MTGLILYGDTTLEFEIWKLSWHFPDVFIVSVVSLKLNSVFIHPPPPPPAISFVGFSHYWENRSNNSTKEAAS